MHKRNRFAVVGVLFVTAMSHTPCADCATIRVPKDRSTIQAAIDRPAIQSGQPVGVWVSYKVDFAPDMK